MTREVIRIDQEKKEDEKPVEFTHLLHPRKGWVEPLGEPS